MFLLKMRYKIYKHILRFKSILLLIIISSLCINAQFYNGHQMSFGKNRVQYSDYYWSFFRTERYDVYFHEDGQKIAEFVCKEANKILHELEKFFDYNLNRRLIFIVFNKLSDFKQSNIGLISGNYENNPGGNIQILNKILLYFEGDYNELIKTLRGSIARAIIYELLMGDNLFENYTNTIITDIPEWFTEGLISFLANEWDEEIDSYVRDKIMTRKFEKFNKLKKEDARIIGHSFWYYLKEVYDESVIPNILFMARVNRNIKSAFTYVLGTNIKQLTYDWHGFFYNWYVDLENKIPPLPENSKKIVRPKKNKVITQVKISPDEKYLCYVSNKSGKYKIWLYNLSNKKRIKIFSGGINTEQTVDYSFPVVAWHPSSKILTFAIDEKNIVKLYYYFIEDKKISSRNLFYFESILSFSFSPDGNYIIISGIRDGQTDLFIHIPASGMNINLTNDTYTDLNPVFTAKDKIVFSSNRPPDTLIKYPENIYNLFYCTINNFKIDQIKPITDDASSSYIKPVSINTNTLYYLNNKSGIISLFKGEIDSTISFIDTIFHYRYFLREKPVLLTSRNILDYDVNKNQNNIYLISHYKDKLHLLVKSYNEVAAENANIKTEYRKKYENLQSDIESIAYKKISLNEIFGNIVIDTINYDTIEIDNGIIDINNYIFEIEKVNKYNQILKPKGYLLEIDTITNKKNDLPKIRIYQKTFYPNQFVAQIDFNFLNESYQPFTGGAVYFNPGVTSFFKVGIYDLFEDYKLTGGVRISPNFDNNEYLVSFENLKNRTDHQWVYHRQYFKQISEETETSESFYTKIYSNNFYYLLKYPFNEVFSFGLRVSLKNDRIIYLSTGLNALEKSDENRYWLGIKLEQTFDNTRSLGKNLLAGLRYKIFAEVYEKIYPEYNDLVVLGGDIRFYLPIHRNLIFASRFAASSSQGSNKLIYYLGGVDNWINITPLRTPTFIPLSEIPIDYNTKYAFQAVGTNLRGFSQNIRNGNNFALINLELRWPIIRYILNHPLSNKFLENFQLAGFFDIGSAWSGKHPWAGKNAYEYQTIDRGSIKMIINTQRKPIVAGTGFGIRSELLGYFIRLDWAWGIENYRILPSVFYLSLCTDF